MNEEEYYPVIDTGFDFEYDYDNPPIIINGEHRTDIEDYVLSHGMTTRQYYEMEEAKGITLNEFIHPTKETRMNIQEAQKYWEPGIPQSMVDSGYIDEYGNRLNNPHIKNYGVGYGDQNEYTGAYSNYQQQQGHYDQYGNYIPYPVQSYQQGYYDQYGNYISQPMYQQQQGYYDQYGNYISQPMYQQQQGYYDQYGNYMYSQPMYQQQQGYYDQYGNFILQQQQQGYNPYSNYVGGISSYNTNQYINESYDYNMVYDYDNTVISTVSAKVFQEAQAQQRYYNDARRFQEQQQKELREKYEYTRKFDCEMYTRIAISNNKEFGGTKTDEQITKEMQDYFYPEKAVKSITTLTPEELKERHRQTRIDFVINQYYRLFGNYEAEERARHEWMAEVARKREAKEREIMGLSDNPDLFEWLGKAGRLVYHEHMELRKQQIRKERCTYSRSQYKQTFIPQHVLNDPNVTINSYIGDDGVDLEHREREKILTKKYNEAEAFKQIVKEELDGSWSLIKPPPVDADRAIALDLDVGSFIVSGLKDGDPVVDQINQIGNTNDPRRAAFFKAAHQKIVFD